MTILSNDSKTDPNKILPMTYMWAREPVSYTHLTLPTKRIE